MAPCDSPIQKFARLSYITLFFQYNNCLLFHIQQSALAQMVRGKGKLPKGLGSIPRSPYLSILFSFTSSDTHAYKETTIHPQCQADQISSMPNLTPITGRSTIGLVKLATWDLESQNRSRSFGPKKCN